MKEHAALVIAALMVTSMALVVLSPSPISASTTLSPTSARANTSVKFTVTVTNGTSDNIDNVRIIFPTGSGFTRAIGTSDNLKLAAENLENATPYLTQAGENLILAEDNKVASGPNFKAAGDNLDEVTDSRLAAENASAGPAARTGVVANSTNAASALRLVADAIDNSIENLDYISAQLSSAGTYLRQASGIGAGPPKENMENVCDAVGENLDNAGADLVTAADNLLAGDLKTAGSLIKDAGDNLVAVGNGLTQADLKAAFQNAGGQLQTAGLKLQDAGNFLDNAGYALGLAENYLTSAGTLLATVTNLATAGSALENVGLMFEAAENQLRGTPENFIAAGDNLVYASDNMDNMSLELGAALGGDEENAASVHIDHAADNLKTSGTVGLTTAGNELKNAATDLSAAASVMLSTANDLTPTTWTMTDGTASDYVNFKAIGDNVITPGNSQTFTFLLTTPNITIENDYTITIAINKEGGGDANWVTDTTATLTVDGAAPTLTIVVTQAGVATNNLIGTALDNARATITITASETLQSIGTVYVENSGNDENFIPPVTLTTTDNLVYTGTFTVGAWDDNSCAVRVTSAKDLVGNENTTGMENSFTVDTRAPIFVGTEQSGLSALVTGMRENVVQAGTGTVFRYVDNTTSKSLVIRVEDNIASSDNDVYVTSVTVNGAAATRSVVVENLWTLDPFTLDEGLNSVITVTATDRTGNTVSDNIENIFIDTAPPTITFNTIAGRTWTDGIRINDNTPEIKVTIKDPGYPTSGLGVYSLFGSADNLDVYLDNDDNINNGTPGAPYGELENKAAWNPSTGVFENIIDNAGKGLATGTYWIIVRANDNLRHAAAENENWVIAMQSFKIDVTPPSWTATTAKDLTKFYYQTTMDLIPTTTKIDSWYIEGEAREARSTIKIYVDDTVFTATSSETANGNGRYDFSLSVQLSEGVHAVYFQEVDNAGNPSAKVLYGTYTVDKTAPVITLSAPAEATTTDAAQITISGTVTDAVVAYDQLVVTIDCTGASVAKTVYLSEDGSFSTTVPLLEGTNVINVVAKDSATIDSLTGNQAIVGRTVTRTAVTPWTTYTAVILVIIALVLAAIAIFRKR